MNNVFSPLVPVFVFFIWIPSSCLSQSDRPITKAVGGPCEGCEAIFEYGNSELDGVDTLPLFSETRPKLKISGTVYQKDGETPAKDVILYIYHTNREGIYQKRGDETGWARRHGFIRGWVKTDRSGKYIFYTFRPGSYPGGTEPAHIHLTIKEPERNEYYLDDFVFKDDPLLKLNKNQNFRNRGGSGIVNPFYEDGIFHIERDIILGLHIPGYD